MILNKDSFYAKKILLIALYIELLLIYLLLKLHLPAITQDVMIRLSLQQFPLAFVWTPPIL